MINPLVLSEYWLKKGRQISLLLLLPLCLSAQTPVSTDIREVNFQIIRLGENHFRFQPQPPPAIQMSGAPDAFWRYFWEFGDGSFSFDSIPEHYYRDIGDFDIKLVPTVAYDNGKPPTSQGGNVASLDNTDLPLNFPAYPETLLDQETPTHLLLKEVRDPRPLEELVIIGSYQNPQPVPVSGKLYFFFNEREAGVSHFAWKEARFHYGEQEAPLSLAAQFPAGQSGGLVHVDQYFYEAENDVNILLEEAQVKYTEAKMWETGLMEPGASRNLFMSLMSTEDMAVDTHTYIRTEVFFVPDDPILDYYRYELEMEIVSAHDPNHIAVSDVRLNYRWAKNNPLSYKVRFQNNGEGPANRIEISCSIPQGLSPQSLEVEEVYPDCPICPPEIEFPTISCLDTFQFKDRLVFVFNNVFLPGSKQIGVEERDSTKGFVRYRIRANEDLEKRPFKSRANIVFDNEDAIKTNYSTTKFKPGFSPGIMIGAQLNDTNSARPGSQRLFPALGFSVAPYKPYRKFLEAELWFLYANDKLEEPVLLNLTRDTSLTQLAGGAFFIDTITTTNEYLRAERKFSAQLYPFQIRKNFNSWIGGGLGMGLDISLLTQTKDRNIRIDEYSREGVVVDSIEFTSSYKDRSLRWSPIIFGDIRFGQVRIGPAVGIRYNLLIQEKLRHQLLLFAAWKF